MFWWYFSLNWNCGAGQDGQGGQNGQDGLTWSIESTCTQKGNSYLSQSRRGSSLISSSHCNHSTKSTYNVYVERWTCCTELSNEQGSWCMLYMVEWIKLTPSTPHYCHGDRDMALQLSGRLVLLLLVSVGGANCSNPRQIVRDLLNLCNLSKVDATFHRRRMSWSCLASMPVVCVTQLQGLYSTVYHSPATLHWVNSSQPQVPLH